MNFTLPQEIQPNQIICIRGIIADNAREYSINFANDTADDPPEIAYQFKCDKQSNLIVQNQKQDGEWMEPTVEDNEALAQGPHIALDFAFSSDEVTVYMAFGEGHNYVTSYELYYDLNAIKSIQVGGDVQRITELTFKYN